ncbi:hypothetical protein K435DRAFT_867353 [Dendrothele bispora CBS 962.96]|uniref:Low temperature requirement A n=1 Tax=Dendrothele bispora (strain CBS 962.96) TaxID=1314807 RepID=A0A4S8LEZ2_DENBC|nr:hypothetical protein K435DRAFT_867353 [Dendrothele bispora CBS 962.96]
MRPDNLANRASRVLSFFRKPSVDDSDPLVMHRKESIVPITRSPFTDTVDTKPGELTVSVSEVPWSDLLLEIAMTTAFATNFRATFSDGTPVLEAANVASYLSFFALVWWVWASQVAYNVRFRQSDWLHRLFIFFQVLVFCALAAFTNNFDITNGISDNSSAEKQGSDLQSVALGDQGLVRPFLDVQSYRDKRLPTLNVRGISMTMTFSRLLLLSQYLIAFYHANRRDRRLRQSAFLVHIGSLIISSLCYFIAFAVIGKAPSKGDEIAKLFLWYIPIFIEVAAHYIAISRFCDGRVHYKSEAILARSSTVFIIILGGGLDKITNGFQFIIGNITFGTESIGLIICGVAAFLLLFTLYFGTPEPEKVGSYRSISLFFFQFVYLAAIIVTLQGIAAMLQVGNLGNALEVPFDFLRESQSLMEVKGLGVPLNESDYVQSGLDMRLEEQGASIRNLLEFVNSWMDDDDPQLGYNALLQMDIYVIEMILNHMNNYPGKGLLLAKLDAFYNLNPDNVTYVNNATFHDVVELVIITNATPALWFYVAGGAVLVTLALMGLIRQKPRDRWEWGQTISRLVMGSVIIAFTAIDIHASNDVLTDDFHYEGSRIWYLATHSWVLPIYALALLIEQVIELILLHFAGRSLGDFGSTALNRSFSRAVYSRTKTSDHDEFQVSRYSSKNKVHDDDLESYFVPYVSYDSDNKTFTSSTSVTSLPTGAPSFQYSTFK